MPERPQQLVAVDLGSNSFHMIIARLLDGQITVVDRMRERVALAEGLDARNYITEDAQERALACLRRFGQRIATVQDADVRAVGTNTLRKARNARQFLGKARDALGHRVEVISGREEARLIYLGVSHNVADATGRRLVVDIGGGSTELIIGERFEPLKAESLHIGCVSHSQRFFGDGRITRQAFKDAVTAARVELETLERAFRRLGWSGAIGSSGTITSIDTIVRQAGWTSEGITRDALRSLREAMIAAGRTSKLSIPGLSDERAGVIPGGLAILIGVFKSLKLDVLSASTGALREGLLYESLGRIAHEDVRDRSIEWMCDRYAVDRAQAARVEATACGLLARVAGAWALDHPEERLLLSWAAKLHEIGLTLSYSGHHDHGAYLLLHSDMPGFAREQQAYLAALVGAHRRKLRPEKLVELRQAGGASAVRLALLLRLAATLNRARQDEPLPAPDLSATAADAIDLHMPDGWLDDHPMTKADLDNERAWLAETGFTLSFS